MTKNRSYGNSYRGRSTADGFLVSFDKRHEAFARRHHESTQAYYNRLHERQMLAMKLEAQKEQSKRCSNNNKRRNYKKR